MSKLKIPLLIIGLAVVLVIVLNIRGCINENRTEDLAKLEGEYSAYKAQVEAQKEELARDKEELEMFTVVLKGEIEELKEKDIERVVEIEEKETEIADLKKKFDSIPESDLGTQVLNLQQQIIAYEEKDRAKDKRIEGLVNTIKEMGKWEVAYNRQSEYVEKLEKRIGVLENLSAIADQVIEKQGKQINRLKVSKKIERIVLIPLSIFGGYKLGQIIFGGTGNG